MKPLILLLFLLGVALPGHGQSNLQLSAAVAQLPPDSATRQLVRALGGLLRANQGGRDQPNPYVEPAHTLETTALLDELRDPRPDRARHDALPDQPYLTNIVRLDSVNYIVQVATLGLRGQSPLLQASFELWARRAGSQFYFYSPLRLRTRAWQSRLVGSCRFYYEETLDRKAAADYARRVASFDKKLGAAPSQSDIYLAGNLPEALRLLGVAYKAEYAGYARNSFSARELGRLLAVHGEELAAAFDPHDLWHQRLRNVLPDSIINKPVDEGCAFSYGGSWGISWPVILQQFRAYAQARPTEDWLATYPTSASVSTGAQRPLLVRYVINALIVQQLERTKGFGAVKQLASCGKYEKGNDNYFRVLEQVAGISRENFNATVRNLIDRSQP